MGLILNYIIITIVHNDTIQYNGTIVIRIECLWSHLWRHSSGWWIHVFNPLSWKCDYSGLTPCHGETLYFGVECYNFNHFLMTSFTLSLPIFKAR